jgi:quercetin dioxygenase-like cupin family protein
MTQTHTYFADLIQEMGEVAPDSIVSRTLYSDETLKVILFGFAPGQELSEHTASMPAVIHILEGKARLTLGGDARAAGPGTWARMPAGMPHSVHAETRVVMLLLLLREGEV